MSEKRKDCVVRDGRFVEPCKGLDELVDHLNGSRAKGITLWSYHNTSTLEPSRSMIGARTKAFPNGFLFNFCPVCGASISAPFDRQEEPRP